MLHSHGPRHGPQSVEAALPRQDPNTSPVHLSPAYRVRVIYGLTGRILPAVLGFNPFEDPTLAEFPPRQLI
jgi:hypothetical protein